MNPDSATKEYLKLSVVNEINEPKRKSKAKTPVNTGIKNPFLLEK
jgi:hypothetical protein